MEEIKNQLAFLLASFLSGVAVMFAYEIVNVIRGLFRPKVLGRLFFDVVFFVISGICVFQVIFLYNNGTIRSFFVFAFAAGAILYRKSVGTIVSDWIVKGIRKICHIILSPFSFVCKKILKKVKKIKKKP